MRADPAEEIPTRCCAVGGLKERPTSAPDENKVAQYLKSETVITPDWIAKYMGMARAYNSGD